MKSKLRTPLLRHFLFLASLLLVLSSTRASAQVPQPHESQAQGEPKRVDAERTRTRLLFLHDGSVLRGSSRSLGEAWEIKLGNRWQTIPNSMVVRATDERALLAEAKRRASKIKRDDQAARVQHARWLREEGLKIECLTTLDRVLRAAPDMPEALSFLQERPLKMALPDPESNSAEFFNVASRMGPAARELAINRLKLNKNREKLRLELRGELKADRDEHREFGLLALRRLYPGEEIQGILKRAVLDRDKEVRFFAALALRDAKNPEVATPVIQALGSKHSILRQHAAEALGIMNYAMAAQPLIASLATTSGLRAPASNIFVGKQTAYVQDFDVEVSAGQSIARPRVNVLVEGAVLDVRVLSSSSVRVQTERRAIRSALTQLTGAKVSSSQKAWNKWWDKHGADWLAERKNAADQ